MRDERTLEQVWDDLTEAMGMSPITYLAQWKRDRIEDTPQNMEWMIECLALVGAMEREASA